MQIITKIVWMSIVAAVMMMTEDMSRRYACKIWSVEKHPSGVFTMDSECTDEQLFYFREYIEHH